MNYSFIPKNRKEWHRIAVIALVAFCFGYFGPRFYTLNGQTQTIPYIIVCFIFGAASVGIQMILRRLDL